MKTAVAWAVAAVVFGLVWLTMLDYVPSSGSTPSAAVVEDGGEASSVTPESHGQSTIGAPADGALIAAGLADDGGVIDRFAIERLLVEIPVDDIAPAGEYDRDLFGQRWADINRNGCDTRNDILARDLAGVTFKPGTRDCVVLTGTLDDPYTGTEVPFARGEGTSDLVPIDHVIPLSWAWQNGADQWAPATRERFANDPLNLQATTREQNTSKSDRGPAEWLPAAETYRCAYIARFVLIATTYDLTIPAADASAAATVIDRCQAAPAAN
jgi:hypothetical protein